MADAGIPDPEEAPRRGPSLGGLVWLVPLAALAATLLLVWQTYSGRGPTVTITFDEAAGVVAGETPLRYRDVPIGLVEEVGFTEGLGQVALTVRVSEEVAPFVDDDAAFWIVRPEISTRGVTGVETVLSGVYIEAAWDEEPEGLVEAHGGALRPPLTLPGERGLRIRIRSTGGEGLAAGTPILYRGLEVGRLASAEIAEDGRTIVADAIVYEPHDRLVTTATRFFDTSGFTFRLGPQGAEVDFKSVAALLSGGISFDTVITGGQPVLPGAVFELYWDEAQARNSVFADPEDAGALRLSAVFDSAASGLVVGAPVELGGLVIGEVRDISGIVDPDAFGDSRVRLITTLAIQPERLGLAESSDAAAVVDFLSGRVEAGLRARLAAASFITGTLKVELVLLPEAEPASIEYERAPYPLIPTVPAEISDVAATAEAFLQRVSALPLDDLVDSVVRIAEAGAAFAENDALQGLPDEALGFVADLRALAGDPALQAAPGQIGSAAEDLAAAADALASLIVTLEEAGLAETVVATTNDVGTAAEAAAVLAAELTALSETANDLPLPEIAEGLRGAVEAAEAVLADEGTRALPGLLAETAGGARDTVVAFRDGGGTEALVNAVNAAATAAEAFAIAAEGAPALVASLTALTDEIAALPLDTLATDASSALASVNAILSSEDAQAIPAEVLAALTSLSDSLEAFEAGGGAEALAGALTAAEEAATSFAITAEGGPALVASLTALADTAGGLPLNEVATAATDALATVDRLLSSEAVAAIPEEARGALAALRASLTAFAEGGGAASLVSALSAAESAAQSIEEAADGAPAVIAGIDAFVARANAVPLEEIAANLATTLASADAILSTEGARDLPASAAAALDAAQLSLAAFAEAGGAEALVDALSAAEGAADGIADAAAGVPALVGNLTRLSETANALPLAPTLQSIRRTAAAAERLIGSEATAALPEALEGLLRQLDGTLADLRREEGVQRLVGALENLGLAAGAIGEAANGATDAIEGIPELVDRLTTLVGTANELPFDVLLQEAAAAAEAARAILDQESAQAIPQNLNAALASLSATLADLRDGGTVANVNAALGAAEEAAARIADASGALPDFVGRATLTLGQVETVIAGYGEDGRVNREARDALRAVADAADAIADLAREIERNPQSLLTGR